MFEKLKRKSLRKIKERHIAQRDLTQLNAPLTTLGFVVDEMTFQDFEKLHEFSDFLGLQRKDVKVFSFLEVKKKTPSLRQNQINNKDFGWKGEILNQNAQEFLNIPFDVLIGYYQGNHEFLDLMVSVSKAKFKVGFEGADARLYDLLMAFTPQQTDAFKVELKKYLEILNKI